MFEFRLPDLGEGIAEAEIISWAIHTNDIIQKDQLLAEVMTDKATVEITSPVKGTIHAIHHEAGETVSVGSILVEINDGSSQESKTPTIIKGKAKPISKKQQKNLKKTRQQKPKPSSPETDMITQHITQAPKSTPPRPNHNLTNLSQASIKEAVPAIRHLAKELGLDINKVQGSGPNGRVLKKDLINQTQAPQPNTEEDQPDWERTPLRGITKIMSERMLQSKTHIPHFTYIEEIDITHLNNTILKPKKQSPLPYIAKTILETLSNYPTLNASLDPHTNELIIKNDIHLGIAVATDEGLMVPVIKNAATLSLKELKTKITDLSKRAKSKTLKPHETKGSTFTITSLGKLGGLAATPIINYPESGIISIHKIRTLPRYITSKLQPRDILNLSISLNHRFIDGITAASFIQDIKTKLESHKK